jgi:hypothetical protein
VPHGLNTSPFACGHVEVANLGDLKEKRWLAQPSFLSENIAVIATDIRPCLIKRLAVHLDGPWPECGVAFMVV